MKRDDLQRLATPYPTSLAGLPESDLVAALGWKIEPWRGLLSEVQSDLDALNFGVGWWKQGAETDDDLRRRIVVSDYLVSLLEGAEHALIDLELHRLELLDYLDREGEFLRDAIALSANGTFFVDMPPRLAAADEIAPALVDLHMNGFLRAGATTFDCLAGVVAIVGALDVGVLRTDWGKVMTSLNKPTKTPLSSTTLLQQTIKARIDTELAASCAPNWQEWLLAYRNLVVHRGHRLKLSQITPIPTLFDASGKRLVRATVSPVLPSDPELTDAEALGMWHHTPLVLEEDARRTIEGLLADLHRVMNGVGEVLLVSWRNRRANPGAIVQPLTKQWPSVRRTRQHSFPGYKPGSQPFNPSALTVNPRFTRRMLAGAFSDQHSALWRRP